MKNQSLYRFTNFESLIDIMQRGALTFVSPSLWKDPYEGFLYSMAKTNDGRKVIMEELGKNSSIQHVEGVLGLLSFIDITYFAQCWTKKDESDALWRIYSHNNSAIRLEVKMENFIKMQPSTNLIIGDVSYFHQISLEDEIKNVISGDSIIGHKALLSKRSAFEHEQEVRLIINNHENLNKINKTPVTKEELSILKNNLNKAVQDGFMPQNVADQLLKENGPINTIYHLPIGNASDFIESIMLHPFAPNWLNDTLTEFCKRAGIKYLGKSKLYELSPLPSHPH